MTTHQCTECLNEDDNPHSTSMCRDCQIKLLMSLLGDTMKDEEIEVIPGDIMLYLNGSRKSFRCECGANVFHKVKYQGRELFRCNGCETLYNGEK